MGLKEHILGLGHIGIPVEDTQAAVEQYRALGFELMDQIFTIAGSSRQVAFLQGHGCTLEVYESVRTGYHGTIDHIALLVNDLEQTLEEANALNLPVLYGGPSGADFPGHASRYFTVEMPGGEKVEFNMRIAPETSDAPDS